MEKAKVTDPCPPLLRLWLDLEAAAGRRPTEYIARLNEAAGTAYTLSRLGEWRNGRRQIPPAVAAVLRRLVMPYVLRDLRITATRRQSELLCAAVSDVNV